MSEEALDKLDKRIGGLEKSKKGGQWLQFFVFPLILAVLGYFLQNAIIESSEKREQFRLAQDIVSEVYNDTIYEKTIAMKKILYQVLENDELSNIIGEVIEGRLEQLVINGTPKEMTRVLKAVETFSTNADSIGKKFDGIKEIQEKVETRNQMAKAKELEAFTYLKNGELSRAERAFRQVDSIYPAYHQAYEISRYLRHNSDKFNSNSEVIKLQEHTINSFPYGAPEKIVEEIRKQIKNPSIQNISRYE
ncbi:MAG: hypothetical protein ACFB0A_14270 [Croceivirga sp.]